MVKNDLEVNKELKSEGLIEKAELVMAIREYDNKKRRRWEGGIDLIISTVESDDKLLMRVINKSSTIGIDKVREMSEFLKRNDYDGGFLVGKKFSKAAKEEMSREGIEVISEKIMPSFKIQRLYFSVNRILESLCKAKCGCVPMEESDCEGYRGGQYYCEIRRISDNAQFHFERGWINLLQNDIKQLLTLSKSESN